VEVAVTLNSWGDDGMTVMQRNVVMRWRTWYALEYGQPGDDTSPEIEAERSWIGLWMWCGTPEGQQCIGWSEQRQKDDDDVMMGACSM